MSRAGCVAEFTGLKEKKVKARNEESKKDVSEQWDASAELPAHSRTPPTHAA